VLSWGSWLKRTVIRARNVEDCLGQDIGVCRGKLSVDAQAGEDGLVVEEAVEDDARAGRMEVVVDGADDVVQSHIHEAQLQIPACGPLLRLELGNYQSEWLFGTRRTGRV